MKTAMLLTLPLAAALIIPAAAQQNTADQQPPAASQSAPAATAPDTNTDQNLSAQQPLQPDTRQGFWGKINPFARKKYVQRQLSPIRNRVNELDDLTAANARQIKDVDARAQQGIRDADAKATQADQHAVDAGNRAQQANQTALQASNRLNTVEQVVGNIDQYQPATQTEIRYRAGQTALSAKAKQALDDMTVNLKDQKGYIIEVQGFSATAGRAGVQSSQAMANSVVRYLVEKNQIPVYRVFVMGMGNAKLPPSDDGSASRAHGNRVEISLMKNNVDQLASASQPNGAMNSGTYNQPTYNANSQPTYNSNNQPSYNSGSAAPPSYSQPAQHRNSTTSNSAQSDNPPQQ
ncbi:MAG TPA: flagellar motor protein MotB [Terriglobales bacterium]|nr:flagellar motor protein MotB [Terriglobales bacterium]